MERGTRAALYARVSTGKQAEKDLSIPDQIKQMRGYCDRKGWVIQKVYTEEGASARDENRPVFKEVFKEMMADALANDHPFDAILTLTSSRFFRDVTGARFWKRRLSKNNVKVVATDLKVSGDPQGSLIEVIFEAIDQYESDINGFHTLRAMKENARQGYYNGSKPKFGFMAVREDGKGQG